MPLPPQWVPEVYRTALPQLGEYVRVLATTGVEWGLMGPREIDRLWDRHVVNSAAVAALIPRGASLVDVGSGAGLPGIPLALVRPDLRIVLLEPLLRRSTFLAQTIAQLELDRRVEVVRGRAEDHGKTYDIVTARAVAPLDRLLGWCVPLLGGPGARMLAIKGQSAQQEVRDASRTLAELRLTAAVRSVRAHSAADETTVVDVTRRVARK